MAGSPPPARAPSAELDNLWDNPSYKDKRFELVNRLLHENLKTQTYYPKRIAET